MSVPGNRPFRERASFRNKDYNRNSTPSPAGQAPNLSPQQRKLLLIMALVVGVAIALGAGVGIYQYNVTGSVADCQVIDKERLYHSKGGNQQLVKTENCGDFTVPRDNRALYEQIKIGETYNFETRGNHVPLLALKPNIVKMEKVS